MRPSCTRWAVLGVVLLALVAGAAVHREMRRAQRAPGSLCISEPLPPDLLQIQTTPGAATGEIELVIVTRPQEAGRLAVQVSTEGSAQLVVDGKPSPAAFSAVGEETRRYRVRLLPTKAGEPVPAVVVEATVMVDGAALMGRTYRLALAPEPPPRGKPALPKAVPDGRGGWLRVFPGASE